MYNLPFVNTPGMIEMNLKEVNKIIQRDPIYSAISQLTDVISAYNQDEDWTIIRNRIQILIKVELMKGEINEYRNKNYSY